MLIKIAPPNTNWDSPTNLYQFKPNLTYPLEKDQCSAWRCVFAPKYFLKRSGMPFFDEMSIHQNLYPTKSGSYIQSVNIPFVGQFRLQLWLHATMLTEVLLWLQCHVEQLLTAKWQTLLQTADCGSFCCATCPKFNSIPRRPKQLRSQ